MDVCITKKLMQKKHEDVDQEEWICTHNIIIIRIVFSIIT
jgi:hypothetical protein